LGIHTEDHEHKMQMVT